MAMLDKRSGSWRFRVKYKGRDGKWHVKSQQHFRTKSEAATAAHKFEIQIAEGADMQRAERPLTDSFHSWWTTYKQGQHSQVTEDRYRTIEKQLREYFSDDPGQPGNLPVGKVTPAIWQRFINDFSAGIGRKPGKDGKVKRRAKDTVQKLNGYVRAMVKRLINEQVLHTDFTFAVTLPADRDRPEKVKYLELDDFAKLTTLGRQEARIGNMGALAAYVATQTGLRVSEVLGLTWDDINPHKRIIEVRRTWDYSHTKDFAPTKNPTSVRDVEVGPQLLQVLARIKTEQAEWMMETGIRGDKNCVFFCPRNGRGQAPGVVSGKDCEDALKRLQANIHVPADRRITFHGLRHTHVSYLLSQGVDIYYISRRLGHANVGITMKVYSHLLDVQRQHQAKLS